MDDIINAALLFDFYGDLLTDKQRRAYGMYYNDNYSLSEISEELSITRQGARDLIRRSADAMRGYDAALGLMQKHNERARLCDEILSALRLYNETHTSTDETINEIISKINRLSEV